MSANFQSTVSSFSLYSIIDSSYFSNLVCNFRGSCEYLVPSLYNFISGWVEPIVCESRSPSAPTTWLSQTTRPAQSIQQHGQSEHCGQTWLDASDQSEPTPDRATKNLSTKEPKCLLAWEPAHSWHRMDHSWPRGPELGLHPPPLPSPLQCPQWLPEWLTCTSLSAGNTAILVFHCRVTTEILPWLDSPLMFFFLPLLY